MNKSPRKNKKKEKEIDERKKKVFFKKTEDRSQRVNIQKGKIKKIEKERQMRKKGKREGGGGDKEYHPDKQWSPSVVSTE